jgi:hypothetical protein
MRIAAIIPAALGAIALYIGIFLNWIGTLLNCFGSCPPIDGFADRWLASVALFLGPGVALTFVASILAILALRADRRRAGVVVAIAAPVVTAALVALILLLGGGSLTPVAGAPAPDGTALVSGAWMSAASYAAIPLALWPLTTFATLLFRAATA